MSKSLDEQSVPFAQQTKMQVEVRESGRTEVSRRNMRNFQRLKVRVNSRARGSPGNLEKQLQTESSGELRSRGYPVKRNVTWKKSRKS